MWTAFGRIRSWARNESLDCSWSLDWWRGHPWGRLACFLSRILDSHVRDFGSIFFTPSDEWISRRTLPSLLCVPQPFGHLNTKILSYAKCVSQWMLVLIIHYVKVVLNLIPHIILMRYKLIEKSISWPHSWMNIPRPRNQWSPHKSCGTNLLLPTSTSQCCGHGVGSMLEDQETTGVITNYIIHHLPIIAPSLQSLSPWAICGSTFVERVTRSLWCFARSFQTWCKLNIQGGASRRPVTIDEVSSFLGCYPNNRLSAQLEPFNCAV